MNKFFRVLLVAALIVLGIWVWTLLFPDPKQAIRSRINKVARLVSITPGQGNLVRTLNVEKLGALFSDDAQIVVDIPELGNHVLSKQEMMQTAMAEQHLANGLKAEFVGVNVELGEGAESAMVNLTLKAKFDGQRDLIVQEFNFTMKKIKGSWLITHVETVNTLKP